MSLSLLWEHFTKSTTSSEKAICKYCMSEISTHGSSTTGLKRHMQSKHKTIPLERIKDKEINNLDKYAKIPVEMIVSKLICEDNMSFNSISKSTSLKYLFSRASYSLPSARSTLVSFVEKVYAESKEKVKNLIAENLKIVSKVCLTLDEWKSDANRKYLNINLHFSNGLFFCLGLIRIHGSGNAEILSQLITKRCAEFNIKYPKDILALTTDGASVMIKLGKISNVIHLQCINHGLHLAVLDFFKEHIVSIPTPKFCGQKTNYDLDSENERETSELCNGKNITTINSILNNIRLIIKIFKTSTLKNDILQKYIIEESGAETKLILDCPTRWCSTEKMISNFLKNISPIKKAFIDMNIEFKISEQEIKLLKEFNQVLAPISNVVFKLSERGNNIWATEIIMRFLFKELGLLKNPIAELLLKIIKIRYKERRNGSIMSILSFFNGHNCNKSTNDEYFVMNTKEIIFKDLNNIVNYHFVGIYEELRNLYMVNNAVEIKNEKDLSFRERINEDFTYDCKSVRFNKSECNPNWSLEDCVKDYEKTGQVSPLLQKVLLELGALKSTSVESERVFSTAGKIVIKTRTKLADSILDKITFLKGFFKGDFK